jgi:hypothetical protein
MNDSALQWLKNRVSAQGTLACGFRRPDGNCICHSLEETCPVAMVEKILGQFDSLGAAVSGELPVPRWSTWAFEQGQIRFVERPDGWRLAVIVRIDSAAASALDSLSQEFLSATFDAQG